MFKYKGIREVEQVIYPIKTINEALDYLKSHTYSETAKYFRVPIGTIASWKHYRKNKTKPKKHYSQEDKLAILRSFKKSNPLLYKASTKVKMKYVKDFLHLLPIKLLLEIADLPSSTWKRYKNYDYHKKEYKNKNVLTRFTKSLKKIENKLELRELAKSLSKKI